MSNFIEIADGFYIKASDIKLIIDGKRGCNSFEEFKRKAKNDDALNEKLIEELEVLKRMEKPRAILLLKKREITEKRYFRHVSTDSKGKRGFIDSNNEARYVITKDNKIHQTSTSYRKLKTLCNESGIKLIDMSDMASVNLSYISCILNARDEGVSAASKNWNTHAAILQFGPGKSFKQNTLLVLTTNELIKLSKSTQEILDQANRFD